MTDLLHPELYGTPDDVQDTSGLHPEMYGHPETWNDVLHHQAQVNINGAMDVNPDHAAKAADISQQTGIPQPAVAADLDTYTKIANTKINRENIQNNPKLMAWLAQNPLHAQVASDDIQNLTFLEKIMQSFSSGAGSALRQNQLGRAGNELQARNLLGMDTTNVNKEIAGLQNEEADVPQLHSGFRLAQDFSKFIIGQADSLLSAAPEAAAGAAFGATAGGVGAIPGAVGGEVVGWKLDQSRIAAGQAYLQMGNIVNHDGQPLSESSKLLATAMVGVGTYALFSIGGKAVKGVAGDVAAKMNTEAAIQAITRPTIQAMLKDAGTTLTKSALMFAAFNGTSTVINQASLEAAKLTSQGNFDTIFNSPEIRQQYISDIADSMEDGLKLGLLLGGIGAAAGLKGDMSRVYEAQQHAAALTNLMDGAEKSKLHSRSMQMFSNFMGSQTEGTPAKEMFIPAEKIAALYQEYGIQPHAKDGLFGFVPNIKEQLEEARHTNGDVVIPTADFVSRLAGSDIGKRLIPDVRMTPDGMSLNEAMEFKKQAAALQKEYSKDATVTDEGRQVYNDVFKQVKDAGYSDADAKVYAGLYAARYATRAERKGTNAVEEYQRVPLNIKNEAEYHLPQLRLERRSIERGTSPGYFRMEDLAEAYTNKRELLPPEKIKSAIPKPKGAQTTEEIIAEAKERIAKIQKEYPNVKDVHERLFQNLTDEERARYFDHLDGFDKLSPEELSKIAEKIEKAPVGPASWQSTLHQSIEDPLYNRALYEAREKGSVNAASLVRSMGINRMRAERLVDRMESEGYIEKAAAEGKGKVQHTINYASEDVTGKYRNGPGQYRTTEKIKSANILAQTEGERHRAGISFEEARTQITLFRDANMSSLAHESGHLWLKELSEDAEHSTELAKDFDTALKYMGWSGDRAAWNKATLEEQRPYHEKFARGFENYLMEGKSPSSALRSVFSKLKDWLLNIYQSAKGLNAPISEEMRGVFDRLLATDDEIQNAHNAVGDRTFFKQTGIGKTEYEAYTKAIEQANAQAHDKLLAKAMDDVRKRYSNEYKEQRQAISDQMSEEVDARQDMQAYRFLRDGTGKAMSLPGMEPFKLDEEAANRIAWGNRQPEAPIIRQLPKNITAKKDGISPDEAAEILGFRSGAELVKAMQKLEIDRQSKIAETGRNDSIRQVQIDTETDRRMAEKYPQPTAEQMQQEALDAVHNQERDKVLGIEARVLARMAGKAQIDVEDIRGWAKQQIDQKNVGDATDVSTYAMGEQKAANLASKALVAGKFDEALKYKRQQILNNELYKEAQKARDEVNSAQKLFARLTNKKTFKGMDQEYTDQIHDLLGRFGFDSGRGEELQRTKNGTLEDFVTRKSEQNGLELAVDPGLFNLAGKPIKEMSMPEFRALDDAIRSMYQLGRDEKLITVGDQKVEFDGVVQQMVTAIRDLGERPKTDFFDPADAGMWAAKKEKLFGTLRAIDASLLKPEALFDWIDKGDPFGVMNTAVFRRLKDAQHNEDLWHQDSAKQIKELVKTMPPSWEKRLRKDVLEDARLTNPETGMPAKFTRQRVISMALNWGNEGNRTKLADGYGWSQADIKTFLDKNLTKEEWNFVQSIWDMFAKHTDELDALQKRVTGVGLDLVQASPFDTPHGRMAGGYYPIVYDSTKSERMGQISEKNNTEALFPMNYTRATTPKGNTISRVEGVKRPIELSLDIAPWKIGQTLHDLAFREAIMDADKLLSNKDVKSAMKDVFGKEYANLLRPWLKYVANSKNIDDRAISWMDKAVDAARANTVIVGIGFRMTTLFKHTMTALSNSIGELGPQWMMKGTYEFYGPGMMDKWNFIKEKSPEMAFRLSSYDKDLMAQYEHLLKDNAYTTFQKNAQYFGHIAISYFDLGSAAPTWLGAYRKALSEGMEDKDAIYFADKTVRNAHGAQGITDRSAIQHATGIAKLTNMFYGFFNHIYNRQRTMFIQGSEGIQNLKSGEFKAAGKDFAGVLGKSFYYITIPAIVEALATNHGPDENKDEGWGEWAAKAIAAEIPAGIPVLRDIAKAAIEGRGYEMSPIAKLVDTILQSTKDIEKMASGEEAPKAAQHLVDTAGYVFGLPTAAPFTAGKFLWDYNDGEVDPQTVNEWINGLTKGKTE